MLGLFILLRLAGNTYIYFEIACNMRPSFHPRLVNGPFEDPGLFVPLAFRNNALLFDLGDLRALSAGDLLKTSHVFVTHTHMDHFVGFDQMLRLLLGRGKSLQLFGPQGFLKNVRGKLQAYTWNLVQNYDEGLIITATEIDAQSRTTQSFKCQQGFEPSPPIATPADLPCVFEGSGFTVRTAILNHQIPSLAFAVKERFHINIIKPNLEALGLAVGPWINRFKALLFDQADPKTEIQVPRSNPSSSPAVFSIGKLSRKITRITPGQKIAYVADALYNADNQKKIIALAKDADHLFIEAAFLEEDRGIAEAKYHLTAHQAGTLARKAQVREMTVFHHSPRYTDRKELLRKEARCAFDRQ